MKSMICAALLLIGPAFGSSQKLIQLNGYLLVETLVNGKGPLLFLLDTGATSSSVTPETARVAGLVAKSRVRLITEGSETVVPAVPDAQIRVGEAAASVEVLIDPLAGVRGLDPRIAGVIGQSFLARFACFIDYRHGRILLGQEAARQGELLAAKFTAERVDGRIVVPVSVLERAAPLRLALDSGAPELVLRCGAACPGVKLDAEREIATNAGRKILREGTLGSVTVGSLRISRPGAVLVEEGRPADQDDGLMPARWFSAVYLGPGDVVGLAR